MCSHRLARSATRTWGGGTRIRLPESPTRRPHKPVFSYPVPFGVTRPHHVGLLPDRVVQGILQFANSHDAKPGKRPFRGQSAPHVDTIEPGLISAIVDGVYASCRSAWTRKSVGPDGKEES
jgi:hypothetical protein